MLKIHKQAVCLLGLAQRSLSHIPLETLSEPVAELLNQVGKARHWLRTNYACYEGKRDGHET